MSWRKLNNIMVMVIIMLGIGYVVNLNYTASQEIIFSSGGIGPTYFPNVLAGILLILCIMVLVKDNKKINIDQKVTIPNVKHQMADKKVSIPNIKYIIFTLVLTATFIASWQFIGYFYINVLVLLTTLVTVYRSEYGIKKSLIVGVITGLATTSFIYILFGKILTISL